jgi:organic hydroperoxide reductase OsmC/OhrA
MSTHRATVSWRREGEFSRKRYSRVHRWRFDGGLEVQASASPLVVPKPWVVDDAVDPEEAFVAAIASCHMLTFLFLAANDGFVVEGYEDEAEGHLTQDGARRWVSEVVLRPRIEFGSPAPTEAQLQALHERAHEECFIAQSVRTAIRVAGIGAD